MPGAGGVSAERAAERPAGRAAPEHHAEDAVSDTGGRLRILYFAWLRERVGTAEED